MLNILLILAFIASVYAYAYKQLPYNVNIQNFKKSQKIKDEVVEINMNNLPDYKIPKWVYKKVFNFNKNTVLEGKNFYHQIK